MINIAIGYLLGSIPFGWIFSKLLGYGDLRKIGSGGTGATNAMRAGGLKLGILVTICDMTKTLVAVYFFGIWAGLASIAGHNFPVWLKFKGGKGLASSAGFLFAISPIGFLFAFAIWLIVAIGFGYSSLAALVVLAVAPPTIGFAISNTAGWALVGLAVLGWWQHRENIKRLLAGTESKIQWNRKK